MVFLSLKKLYGRFITLKFGTIQNLQLNSNFDNLKTVRR